MQDDLLAVVLQPAGASMLAAVLAIVLIAPFELVLFAIPGVGEVTTVEAVALGALPLILWRLGARGAFAQFPLSLAIAGVVFLVVLGVAAAVAPIEPGNAWRFVARMSMAAVVFVAVRGTLTTLSAARLVVRVNLAVATLVAVLALLEAAQVPWVMHMLTTFRPGFHVVGGHLRATGTLLYPTIASMYLEVAFALGLWLLVDPGGRRPALDRRLAFVGLAVVGAGIVATFTRAGLIGAAAALGAMAALRLGRVPRAHAGIPALTLLAATLVAVVFVLHSPELLAARATTEGTAAWYGARYETPARLTLDTGRVHYVPVTLTNTGRLTWDSTRDPAFSLAYHWLRDGSEEVVLFEGQRTPFPHAVPPGASVAMEAAVIAPGQPGRYTLVWDVVHETRAWLSTEGVTPARTSVDVVGEASGVVATRMPRLPPPEQRPPRPVLWRAAIGLAANHPWLGIGPDNFRHAYGPYAGVERWDRRVHANNMYLEVLTGAGVAGLGALVWLLLVTGGALVRLSRTVPARCHAAVAASLAAWLMVALHGLADSFLSFTTTYVTFAVAGGLAFSPGVAGAESDAHRI